MNRKKIICITSKDCIKENDNRQTYKWFYDCQDIFDVQLWGLGFNETTIIDLQNKIDSFKPDYIYATGRHKYSRYNYITHKMDEKCWVPDLTNIKVPKIFVEVDTQKWDVNDSWYEQFDKVMCREPSWNGWGSVPLFRWSVPAKMIVSNSCALNKKRKGVIFLGHIKKKAYYNDKLINDVYKEREEIYKRYKSVIQFKKTSGKEYWKKMYNASAVLCPGGSVFGKFTPMRLFECLATGAAIITNCDLDMAGIPEAKGSVIVYRNIKHLNKKLKIDFSKYYNKTIKIARNHTHKIRYQELFG